MNSAPRIVSLFSGVGGLDMGVEAATGGTVIAHAEIEPGPSRVLAHHWPDVPNLGSVTDVDWEAFTTGHPEIGDLYGTYRPSLIICGGFPCQDVSLAGARRGLKEGTRSGLWSEFARAIAALKPGLVVIENVRGLLSAEAAGPMESDPWGLGDGSDGVALRALGAVLGNLAELGYDARWCGVRAADAGAPHGRFRVFIVAYPHGSGQRQDVVDLLSGQPDFDRSGLDTATDTDHVRLSWDRRARGGRAGSQDHDRATEDTPGASWAERGFAASEQAKGGRARPDFGRRGGASASDSGRVEGERRGDRYNVAGASRPVESIGNQRERNGHAPDDRRPTASDTASGGRDGRAQGEIGEPLERATTAGRSGADWGVYGPAIERWEHVTGRLAPDPTEGTARNGAQRLSPRFVEWMMGLPTGHVTDRDLTRTEQLKALGNGVVPQQAALAVTYLLSQMGWALAA